MIYKTASWCRRAWPDSAGATIVLVAVMLPLLVGVMAVTVDMGRLYVVQTKVQSALDTALLGAVATGGTVSDIAGETTRLFNANYPSGYMGAALSAISVTQPSPGVYQAAVKARVETVVVGFGGNLSSFAVSSRVTSGYQTATQKSLELALVLDNSRNITASVRNRIRSASKSMVDTIFGSATTLPNVHVSVVHYNTAVNVGTGRSSWVQPSHVALYNAYALLGFGFMSNRNPDSPPDPSLTDYSDAAPLAASAKFRLPAGAPTNTSGTDTVTVNNPASTRLGQTQVFMNNKNTIKDAIDAMGRRDNLRINVGLMWGWFTLSPNWQGVWSGSFPTKPANVGPTLNKSLVLVVGGKNNVFLGVGNTSNDNVTTSLLCEAIKAQGITLYVVGYATSASGLDTALLSNCASRPSYYFTAGSSGDLNTAFETIASDIAYTTLRLSQ